jgi:hypothetical protein
VIFEVLRMTLLSSGGEAVQQKPGWPN